VPIPRELFNPWFLLNALALASGLVLKLDHWFAVLFFTWLVQVLKFAVEMLMGAKLPRFRLATLVKVIIVVNVTAALVWSNQRWSEFPTEGIWGYGDFAFHVHGVDVQGGRFRQEYSWLPEGAIKDPVIRVGGFPKRCHTQSGFYQEDAGEMRFAVQSTFTDPAGCRFNVAVCVSILLGTILFLRVVPRLANRWRNPAEDRPEQNATGDASDPDLADGDHKSARGLAWDRFRMTWKSPARPVP
jgi:hypothetical protein